MDYRVIIEKLRVKDPACLEMLYILFGQKFYGYCVHKWHLDEDAAWEVVYKTLETLVVKGGRYDFESDTHFGNFLFKVLVNFLRQHYRKTQASKVSLEFVDMDSEELPENISAHLTAQAFKAYYQEDQLTENPALLALQGALNELDPLERELLLLKAQNYTYDEIATILSVENNQLKVKHHRAKQKLVNLLKDVTHHEHA